MMLRKAHHRTMHNLRRLFAFGVSSVALAGFAFGQERSSQQTDDETPVATSANAWGRHEMELEPAAEGVRLVSCYACGNPANACSCGINGANGPMGAGAAADLAGECQFTNPFWCNPYGDVVRDYCDLDHCADCSSSAAPLWYASTEFVTLARDQKDDLAFATLGAGGPVALDTGDIKTEFDAGMRLLLGVTLTDVFRLEGSYLGSFEWSGRAAVRNADDNGQGGFGNLFSPFSNFGTPVGFLGTDFNNFASIDMASSFHSGEVNLRRRLIIPRNAWPQEKIPCYATSFLMGLRYMQLDEHFGYLSSSTVPAGGSNNSANINTTNEMFGAQIGLLSQFLVRGQGWIDFDIKGGIYQNQATMRSAYVNSDGQNAPLTQFNGTDARDRTAFLGELSLTYNRQLTTHLSCRLGYNAFWLTGVALASQNLNTDINLLALGPAQLDHSGDLVMHGPTFGLTYAY